MILFDLVLKSNQGESASSHPDGSKSKTA